MNFTHLNRPTKGLAALLAATGLMVSAAACGTQDQEGSGTTHIDVGVLAFADVAPFYIAQEEGLFKKEGLTVKANETLSGAAQIPSMVSGEIDINYGSYVSLFQAIEKGLPLHVIRENNRPGSQGIFVGPDSDVEKPVDLAGKTIAVNSHGSIQDLTSKAVLESHGVDPKTLKFVEVPPSEMVAALDAGNVDAAWLVEPFVTMATSSQYKKIVSAWEGPTKNFPVAGWATTEKFVKENPKAAAAFIRAMDAALEMVVENPEMIAKVVPTYTKITEDVAAKLAEDTSAFAVKNDLSDLDVVSSLMQQYGLIEKPIDVKSVWVEPSELK